MDVYTDGEVKALAKAMKILKSVDSLDMVRSIEDDERTDRVNAISAGKIEEAAGAASDAIFNALNTAKSYGSDPAAGRYFEVVE